MVASAGGCLDAGIAAWSAEDGRVIAFHVMRERPNEAVSAVIEQEAVNRLATVRLDAPHDVDTAAVVDLLFASSGIEPELAHDADLLEVLPGVTLPVACVAHLIVLKLLARALARPQGEVDLVVLLDAADEEDLRIARRLAQLVVERGYHRGRDLVAELESAAASLDPGGS